MLSSDKILFLLLKNFLIMKYPTQLNPIKTYTLKIEENIKKKISSKVGPDVI